MQNQYPRIRADAQDAISPELASAHVLIGNMRGKLTAAQTLNAFFAYAVFLAIAMMFYRCGAQCGLSYAAALVVGMVAIRIIRLTVRSRNERR